MKQQLVRDALGRIQGSVADYYFDNDEVWEDYKEDELLFPQHNQYDASPVTISYINKK